MNFREYQQKVMDECIQDAYQIIDPNIQVNWHETVGTLTIEIISIANAMFALRCKHEHYFHEEIKKTFKNEEEQK